MEHVLKQTKTVNIFFHKKNSKKINHGLVMQKSVTRRGLGILQGLFCSIQIWIDITWRSDPFLDQDPWELPWIPWMLNVRGFQVLCYKFASNRWVFPKLNLCWVPLTMDRPSFIIHKSFFRQPSYSSVLAVPISIPFRWMRCIFYHV